MMVKLKKFYYIDRPDHDKLKIKLALLGYSGNNSLANFLRRCVNDDIIFVSKSSAIKIEIKSQLPPTKVSGL